MVGSGVLDEALGLLHAQVHLLVHFAAGVETLGVVVLVEQFLEFRLEVGLDN